MVFHKPDDYRAFVQIMSEASIRIPMRILAYCLMPNHFHIERNPLRAHLVERAEARPWSSLPWLSKPGEAPVRLDAGTVPRGSRWIDGVNESSTDPEVERVRECIRRDRPFGSPSWTVATARGLGLESSPRSRGRRHGPGSDQSSRAAEDGTSNSG